MIFDKPIELQKRNEISEEWEHLYDLHAHINKARNDSEYLNGGAIRSKIKRIFTIRYFSELEEIEANTQDYRLIYKNQSYNITAYDDYMMKHQTIKLLGELY